MHSWADTLAMGVDDPAPADRKSGHAAVSGERGVGTVRGAQFQMDTECETS